MSLHVVRQTALGAALALAVTVTAAAAPASAATPRPGVTPVDPLVTQPVGSIVVQPQASTFTFYPDVRVNYLGKTAGSGGKVTYRFRVQNIGAASASNVGLGTGRVIGSPMKGFAADDVGRLMLFWRSQRRPALIVT